MQRRRIITGNCNTCPVGIRRRKDDSNDEALGSPDDLEDQLTDNGEPSAFSVKRDAPGTAVSETDTETGLPTEKASPDDVPWQPVDDTPTSEGGTFGATLATRSSEEEPNLSDFKAVGSASSPDASSDDDPNKGASAFGYIATPDSDKPKKQKKKKGLRSRLGKREKDTRPDWAEETPELDPDDIALDGDSGSAFDEPTPKKSRKQKTDSSLTGRVAILEDSFTTVVTFDTGNVTGVETHETGLQEGASAVTQALKLAKKGRVVLCGPLSAGASGVSTHAAADQARRLAEAQFLATRFGDRTGSLMVDEVGFTLRELAEFKISPSALSRITLLPACIPRDHENNLVVLHIGETEAQINLLIGGRFSDWLKIPDVGFSSLNERLSEAGTGQRRGVIVAWADQVAEAVGKQIPQWGALLTQLPEIWLTGTALNNREAAGVLVRQLRNRTSLQAIEASPSDVGILDTGEAVEAPAAHAVIAAQALKAETLSQPHKLLNARKRRSQIQLLSIAAAWIAVTILLVFLSLRAGKSLDDLTASERREADDLDSLIASFEDTEQGEELSRIQAIIDTAVLLDVRSPGWEDYFRWAFETHHSLSLDRSSQASASVKFNAVSLQDAVEQRDKASAWLDCFGRRVFDLSGYAETSGIPLDEGLALRAGDTDSEEDEVLVELGITFGLNPLAPASGADLSGWLGEEYNTAQADRDLSSDSSGDGGGGVVGPAVWAPIRDAELECGDMPDIITGEEQESAPGADDTTGDSEPSSSGEDDDDAPPAQNDNPPDSGDVPESLSDTEDSDLATTTGQPDSAIETLSDSDSSTPTDAESTDPEPSIEPADNTETGTPTNGEEPSS